jgi:hypothetical protein
MIDSILLQKPDMFLLQIPKVFERTKESYIIPDFLQNHPLLKIMYCDVDYGPGTKLIPTIHYLKENHYPLNTRILYCDDDIEYPLTMISNLRETNPNMVWTCTGFQFEKKNIGRIRFVAKRNHQEKVHVAEGFGGVCVTLGMFSDEFPTYLNAILHEPLNRTSDDLVFSNYFAKQNIPIYIFHSPSYNDSLLNVLRYGNEKDALHLGANNTIDINANRYRQVLQLLQKQGMYYFSPVQSGLFRMLI